MTESRNLKGRWLALRPTKAATFWSCAACVVAAIAIGFTWGGWTTAASAQADREDAVEEARAELAARVCAERFMRSADAGQRLQTFRDSNQWDRDDMLREGDWAVLAGMDQPVDGAVDGCAARLMNASIPDAPAEGEAGGAAAG